MPVWSTMCYIKIKSLVVQLMCRWASDVSRTNTRHMPAVLLSAKVLSLDHLSACIARSVSVSYCFTHAPTHSLNDCGHEFLLIIMQSQLKELKLPYNDVDFAMATLNLSYCVSFFILTIQFLVKWEQEKKKLRESDCLNSLVSLHCFQCQVLPQHGVRLKKQWMVGAFIVSD